MDGKLYITEKRMERMRWYEKLDMNRPIIMKCDTKNEVESERF